MGDRLLKYFDWIKGKSGMQGQMRLAMKSGMSSTKAATEADSDANLQKVHAAAKEIAGSEPPKF
jgi:hypothetical protein